MGFDPKMKLYGPYILSDLCVTQQKIANLPTDQNTIDNLRWLAKVLDQITKSIGPFTIISAFRSSEVQDAVAGSETKKSFHEVGMAADIYPVTMDIDQFFGMLLSSSWRNKLGEIILKKDQNTIHIGLPTKTLLGKIMKRTKVDGKFTYVLMPIEEQEEYTRNIQTLIVETGYESNDELYSIADPSGGLFTDLYMGMFPVLQLDYSKDLEAAIKQRPGFLIAGLGVLAAIAAIAVIV